MKRDFEGVFSILKTENVIIFPAVTQYDLYKEMAVELAGNLTTGNNMCKTLARFDC